MQRDSDEEEEHQLIQQHNQWKPPPFFKFQKRYLFAILPLSIIVFFYFAPDPHSVFSLTFSSLHQSNHSQLRALSLLRQQNLLLLRTLNSTSPELDNLKSALIHQISLNSQIQQVLLNPHGIEDFDDRCRTVGQNVSHRRSIKWKPKANKYLLALCVSEHLICLQKHMFIAALLNRVLIIPNSKLVDYEYDRVLDIDHINQCMGTKVVIPFEQEFSKNNNHHHHHLTDRSVKLLCYFALPQPCFVDGERLRKKMKLLGLSMSKPEVVWAEEDTKKPTKRTVEDVVSKFSSDEPVVAIGDVYYANMEWMSGPVAHHCNYLIQPTRLILLTAQRFIQTFLGRNFVALHFPRNRFLKFCNDANQSTCFYPIPQAADCISRVVERANAPVIYLSTDAAESDIRLLQSLIVVNGRSVPLVKRPPRNSAEKWDALLYRHHIDGDPQVQGMLEKTICAMSSVFIGASRSTFTRDIQQLRKDWGSASLCDQYLCKDEEPNVVTENELVS
ncbi:unnamed protein product [Lathyrus oleraceus]|nr:O-fucosyltransferase 5-like [Pisum sativum]